MWGFSSAWTRKDNCGDELASVSGVSLSKISPQSYFFFRYVGSFNVFTILVLLTWPDRQDVGIVSLSMQGGREGGRTWTTM